MGYEAMKPTTFRDSDVIHGILMAIANQAPGRYFWAGDVVHAAAAHYRAKSTIPDDPPGLGFMHGMEAGACAIGLITEVNRQLMELVEEGIIAPVGKSKASRAFLRGTGTDHTPRKGTAKKRKTSGSAKAYEYKEEIVQGSFFCKAYAIDYHYEPGLRWIGYEERDDVVAFWKLLVEARGVK